MIAAIATSLSTPVAQDDRRDQARGHCDHQKAVVIAAPFITARRLAKVIATVVDALGIAPVVVADPLAAAPMIGMATITAPAPVAPRFAPAVLVVPTSVAPLIAILFTVAVIATFAIPPLLASLPVVALVALRAFVALHTMVVRLRHSNLTCQERQYGRPDQ